MADSILRLRVESQEYDNKLKRAAEGIRHLADVAHKGGGELTGLEKAELDYIKALGDMETKSRTAAGSTRELENAFKELTVIYNNLNDVEKADEGGKALAASLETLKQRALDAKAGLNEATQALQGNEQSAGADKSGIEGLTSALGINVKSLMGWGTALAAGKVALDVAKDAFMSSETNVDEWGRTVQSAEGIYQSFLQSLNSGDFTSFLNNIGQVTQAARDAYNALDELGTRMTIINPERAKLQARQQELRATIRRNGAESEVGKQALAELKKIEPLLAKSFQTESKMNYNAFEKLVRERLAEGGINLDQKSFNQFMKTFSSDAAFQNLRKNARGTLTQETIAGQAYNPNATRTTRTVDTRNTEQKLLDLFTDEWRKTNSGYLTAAFQAQGGAATNMLGNSRYMKTGTGGAGGSGTTKQDIQFADDSIMAQEKLVQDLTQKWKTASAAVKDEYKKQLDAAQSTLDTMMGKTAKAAAQPQMVTGLSGFNEQTISAWTSMIKSELAKADIGSDLYNSLTKNLRDMSFLTTTVQDAIKLGLEIPQDVVEQMYEQVFDQNNLPTDMYVGMIQKFIDDFKEKTGKDLQVGANGSLSEQKPEKQGKEEDDFKKFNDGIGKLTGGLSQVSSGLKAVGVEIPKEVDDVIGVISGVSQIISGVGSIISLFSTTAITANTAAVVANTAALGVNTATNFIPFFAGGGIVPHAANGYFVGGNKFSGDTTPIMANAGELVLNKAQQGNLAAQLEGSPVGGTDTQPYLDGEKIFLGLQAYTRRSGLGEIVTSER